MDDNKLEEKESKTAIYVAGSILIIGSIAAVGVYALAKHRLKGLAHSELHQALSGAFDKGEDIVYWDAFDGTTYEFLIKFLKSYPTRA